MAFQVLDDDGTLMDAHFDLEGADIVFHSRGGSGEKITNGDYDNALRLLLGRIVASSMTIEGVWVDSSTVKGLPLEDRLVLTSVDAIGGSEGAFRLIKSRMSKVGRREGAKGSGNPTKRIRIRLYGGHTTDEIRQLLRARATKKDLRSQKRLPAAELHKVTPDHIARAVQRILAGYSDHGFGPSENYDLIADDGTRLPPKAVFGVAATEVLGLKVLPEHFSGGTGTPCFNALQKAGYQIVPKGGVPKVDMTSLSVEDRQWTEGKLKLVLHLKRERGSGLSEHKKADFIRVHGKLFCERCEMDPSEVYGPLGACIEVHHHKTQVADMDESHRTKPADLMCLCANCHRVVHRELKEKI